MCCMVRDMKTIEVKDGATTKIKIVPDNYEEPELDFVQSDLTTSIRKSIGFSDISKEKWDRIFKNGKTSNDSNSL